MRSHIQAVRWLIIVYFLLRLGIANVVSKLRSCVYCIVEDKLSVCMKFKTPSCIPKKKLKLFICTWITMTWSRISESTFPSKISSHNSWRQSNYLKCFVVISLWQPKDLNTIICHQSFLVHCLLLNCWKLLAFLESMLFFFYDF